VACAWRGGDRERLVSLSGVNLPLPTAALTFQPPAPCGGRVTSSTLKTDSWKTVFWNDYPISAALGLGFRHCYKMAESPRLAVTTKGKIVCSIEDMLL